MTITVPILDIMQKKTYSSWLVDNPIDTERLKDHTI